MNGKFSYIFLLFIIITGCENSSNSTKDTYIGGEIVNPSADYVIISQNGDPLDTLFLNSNNQFGARVSVEEEGIYSFRHPPESQIMYLEPGDSTIIYLNTLAFDESLNFSGTNADASNFLLQAFLLNEKNNDLVLSYYRIEPAEFAKITDSIRKERSDSVKRLGRKKNFSKKFSEIAKASVDYEYYDLRERYAFLITKYSANFAERIPEDFFEYRKEIDFNKESLQNYYVYMNLIDDYLRTRSIEDCAEIEKNQKVRDCYNLNSYRNIKRRISLADSLIEIPEIKDSFINRLASQAITLAANEQEINNMLAHLEDLNFSDMESLTELATVQKDYFEGQTLIDKKLLNSKKEVVTYEDVIKKPSVVYIWSAYSPEHYKWQQGIIEKLRQKYPEVDFIGINIDKTEPDNWLQVMENNDFREDLEYQIYNRHIEKEIFRRYLYKILFLQPPGKIIKGDAQLNTPSFENEILEFLNQ